MNNTYSFDFNGEIVSVTSEETMAFYPADYGLTENEIAHFAAKRTALAKYHSSSDYFLDAKFVKRLLDEEKLMKNRESDSAIVQLHFRWFIRIKKEAYECYAPFKYMVEADCLDSIQTFKRRYITLEDAILHCLNGFNDNPNIPDSYKSVREFIEKSSDLSPTM